MNARRKRAAKGRSPHPEKDTPSSDSPAPSSRQKLSQLVSAGSALDECIGAISLVEVAMHSLESQDIASPEQEVLKRALNAIWLVHDWIYELKPCEADTEDVS
jgi:hypothetical protein